MHRSRFLAAAFLVVAVLANSVVDAGERKPLLIVTGRKVEWDGKNFALPCPKADLVAVLGKPDRTHSPGGGNDVLVWDKLGFYAYVRPGSGEAFAMSVAFGDRSKHFDFAPKNPFKGWVIVDDAIVAPDKEIEHINETMKGRRFILSYAKYVWRTEGDGFCYFIHRGTAEKLAENAPILDFQVEAIEKKGPVEELQAVMAGAGYTDKLALTLHLEGFVRFGSKKSFDQFVDGDVFDRIEVDKASKEHRDMLRKRRFTVGLPFRAIAREDIETRGLVVRLELPLRVRGRHPFYDDATGFSGVLAAMHPSEVDTFRIAFLKKNGTVQYCSQAEAAEVRRNNGVLYYAETANTTLAMTFKDKLDVLRDISRNAKDFTIEIDLSELRFERPLTWGLFRTDALLEANWDSQKVWNDFLLDDKNPQPVYFPTAFGKEEEARIPWIIRATLDSVRVVDRDRKVIGGWQVEEGAKGTK